MHPNMSHNEFKRLDDDALKAMAEYFSASIKTIADELRRRADEQARRDNLRAHFSSARQAGYDAMARIRLGISAEDACEEIAFETGLTYEAVREALKLARRRPKP